MKRFAIALLVAALMTSSAFAAPPADKGPKGKGHQAGGDATMIEAAIGVVFSVEERDTISRYFAQHPVAPQRLPPGIAKNLARGKPLPPGIAKKALPQGLAVAIPNRPGYECVMAGSDVLLVEVATQVVTDVLRNVVR